MLLAFLAYHIMILQPISRGSGKDRPSPNHFSLEAYS